MNIQSIISLTNAKPNKDGYMGHCPAHEDKSPSFSFKETSDGKILMKCFAGCSYENIRTAINQKIGYFPANTTRKEGGSNAARIELFKQIYENKKSILENGETPASNYLKIRGLDPKLAEGILFYGKNLSTQDNGAIIESDALLVPIKNWINEVIGLQRIFVDQHGHKQSMDSPKKVIGSILGNAFFGDVKDIVHIAEGPETTLAVYQAVKEPCLSTLSASNLKQLSLPSSIKEVHIWADNDKSETGQKAARHLAENLFNLGKKVFIHLPQRTNADDKYRDWLDVFNEEGEIALQRERFSSLSFDEFDLKTLPKPKTLSVLNSEKEPPISYLVDGLLPMNGISLMVGRPKRGKSTIARQLIACISNGNEFMNRSATKGVSLYIALEEKLSEIKKHFQDLNVNDPDSIFIHCDLAPKNSVEWLSLLIKKYQPQLVVIDPLFRFLRAKDSNSYSEVNELFEPLMKIVRENNCHILCVHHANKSEGSQGNEVLGSTAIFGAVDTTIFLKTREEERIIQSIQRYGEDLEESILSFDKNTRKSEIVGEKRLVQIAALEKDIFSFLSTQQNGEIEPNLKKQFEAKNTIFRSALQNMVEQGSVLRVGDGKKGSPYIYHVNRNSFPDFPT